MIFQSSKTFAERFDELTERWGESLRDYTPDYEKFDAKKSPNTVRRDMQEQSGKYRSILLFPYSELKYHQNIPGLSEDLQRSKLYRDGYRCFVYFNQFTWSHSYVVGL